MESQSYERDKLFERIDLIKPCEKVRQLLSKGVPLSQTSFPLFNHSFSSSSYFKYLQIIICLLYQIAQVMSLTASQIARVYTSAQHELQIQKTMRRFTTLRKSIRMRHMHLQENMRKLGKHVENQNNQTVQKLVEKLRDFSDHAVPLEDLEKKLGTNRKKGLTQAQAERRITQGQNQVEDIKPPNPFLLYIGQVSDRFSLLLWVLFVLAIVGFVALNDSNQMLLAVILFLTINSTAIVAFYFERKSFDDMVALQKLIPQFTTVIRDGAHKTIMMRKVVKGDLVVLQSGQKISADVRIIESNGIKINKSTFTGESDLVPATAVCTNRENPLDSANMAYCGAIIEEGQGKGIVVSTGDQMLLSSIKEVVAKVQKKQNYLKNEIESFVNIIIIFAIAIGIFTFVGGIIVGFPIVIAADISIGVLVASAPCILNLQLTCIMAFAVLNLAKKNIVCRTFTSVQSLGATQILCTDKTGTLTTNRMSMESMHYNGKFYKATNKQTENIHDYEVQNQTFISLMKCAILSSVSKFDISPPKEDLVRINSRRDVMESEKQFKHRQIERKWRKKFDTLKFGDRPLIGDSTENALVRFFQPIFDIEQLRLKFPVARSQKQNREARNLFTSKQKYSYSIHHEFKMNSFFSLYIKGAPEKIWGMCKNIMIDGDQIRIDETHRQEFHEVLHKWGKQGKRVLAFATLKMPKSRYTQNYDFQIEGRNFSLKGLTFIGMVSLHDPPRKGVPETLLRLKQAGTKVIMVTGDQEGTAVEIGRQCNIISDEQTNVQMMKNHGMSFKQAMIKCKNLVFNGDQLTLLMEEDQLAPKHQKGNNFRNIAEKEGIIFARTSPAQKLYITEKLQSLGFVVTVIGDGVNDSPAIKIANTGIAMNSGSDAAKEAADMVLTDDNFNSILVGIQEGRRLFDNFKKAICYVMTSQVSEWMPFVFLITARIPIPIFTLLIDGVVDFIPTLAFAFEESESGIMSRPPKDPEQSLVNYRLFMQSQGWMGMSSFVCCLFAYYICMIDFGFVPSTLWGNSNRPIFLEEFNTDHYNPSDSFFGNSKLRSIQNCDQFDEKVEPVDWINTLFPNSDLRMSALTCHTREDGSIYFKQFMHFDQCRVQQISPYSLHPACFTTEATKYGQTSYMLANVVNQFFNWVICRTRYDSAILKRFTNKIYVMGVGFEFMLAMALCYAFIMIRLIGTRDVIFAHWGLAAIPYSLIQLTLDELRKFLIRNLPEDKNGKPNWFIRNTLW